MKQSSKPPLPPQTTAVWGSGGVGSDPAIADAHPSEGETRAFIPTQVVQRRAARSTSGIPSAGGDSGEIETPPLQAMPASGMGQTPRGPMSGGHTWRYETPSSSPMEPPHYAQQAQSAPLPLYPPNAPPPNAPPPYAPPPYSQHAPQPQAPPAPYGTGARPMGVGPAAPPPSERARGSQTHGPASGGDLESGSRPTAPGPDTIPLSYVVLSVFFLMIAGLGFGVWLVFSVISL